jgi:hypothetical protein
MLITYLDSLCPGMDYWVDVRWNLINTVRIDAPTHFVGKFMRLCYVSGTYAEYPDSDLIVMCDPGRTNVVFLDIDGHERHVSSLNRFYQRYRPTQIDLSRKMAIRQLRDHFPPELCRIITEFCGGSKVAKFLHKYVCQKSLK